MFGIDDAIIGAVGGSLVSGLMNNSAASSRQDDAQSFSAEQYATRYQTSVKDMQAAGLNPMLAIGGLSGSSPTSSAASSAGVPDLGASLNASRLSSAQIANIKADTENKDAQRDLMEAQAMRERASAWQAQDTSNLLQMQHKEIVNKLENEYYKKDADRLVAVAQELKSQYDLNIQKGLSEQQARNLMLAQGHKLVNETKLLDLDLDARNSFGNIGAQSKELKVILDVLMGLIKGR